MSLYTPPLYERVAVYDEQGKHYGYIVRQCGLQPGETLMPIGADFPATIQFAKDACDAIRYD